MRNGTKHKGRGMHRTKLIIAICGLIFFLAGCAVQKYRAAPISAPDEAARLEKRSLQDPNLHAFLRANLPHPLPNWPLKEWNLQELALAACYFNPQMQVAEAQAQISQAAIVAAGTRPNPSVSVQPGVPSPWLFSLHFNLPIQTAGKRHYQILRARDLNVAGRFGLANTSWTIRSSVRAALLNYLISTQSLQKLREQRKIQSARVTLLETRFKVGEISRPEVDLARINLDNQRLAVSSNETEIAQTRAALAQAIGVPVSALANISFSWPNLDAPPDPASISEKEIARDAVLNRLDVREALANYSAAQANLQLQVARQYPDIQIGPGYSYEEGNNYFTLLLSAQIPIFNRNQGPIAEAKARRKEAAAQFLATQARVIAQSETAWAAYRGAWKELAEAKALRRIHASRVGLAQNTYQVGESGPLPLNSALLQSAISSSAELTAVYRAQAALGALENALQRPVASGEIPLLLQHYSEVVEKAKDISQ